MGSNHSKPCAGDPEREYRRGQLDWSQMLYEMEQAREASPDTEQDAVHVHCREDEADRFLEETNEAPVVFHFKVQKPEGNSLEGGGKPGTAVLVGATVETPGGDVTVRLKSNGDAAVGTGAQLSGLGSTVTGLCNEVVHALQDKSSRGFSERTKGHSAVEDLSPSSLESQPSELRSGPQTRSPGIGVPESLSAGDIHCPSEDAFSANNQKASCGIDLECSTEDMLGVAEEPTTWRRPLRKLPLKRPQRRRVKPSLK